MRRLLFVIATIALLFGWLQPMTLLALIALAFVWRIGSKT